MDRLAPFTAVPPAEATQLERTLRVAHDFLTVLGVAPWHAAHAVPPTKTRCFECTGCFFGVFGWARNWKSADA